MASKFLSSAIETKACSAISFIMNGDSSCFGLAELIQQSGVELNHWFKILNKCIIVELSHPATINIQPLEIVIHEEEVYNVIYRSHVEVFEEEKLRTFFRFNNCLYCQNDDNSIKASIFGHKNQVVIVSVIISVEKSTLTMQNVQDFIYCERDQKKLRRTRLKHLDTESFDALQDKRKERDRMRNQSSERKYQQRIIDKARDQNSE